jgi:hypothetical protein
MQVTDADLERLHHEQWEFDRRFRFIYPASMDVKLLGMGKADKVFANEICREVRQRLIERNYTVRFTGDNDHFDLWCNGARIEVKASRYTAQGYRFNMRSNDADVLILACQNSRLHFFVIPFGLVRGKCYVKIPSHDPEQYVGMYTCFFEAWEVVDEAVARSPERYQLALW